MTSAPRPAPFRMPDRLFAQLASGGGSPEAVAFLERGERARRLLLLRTLLDRLADLPTPLTPVAQAWATFKEAAERAPEAVDRLLLAPTTGGWIAHMLRRVHGTATGPPLWAEAGRLNVLAITASLHAGTERTLTVPLTDGGLHLPGLGTLRVPDESPGPSVARAATRAGELTFSGPPRHDGTRTLVTCRPTTTPARSLRPDGPRAEGPRPDGPRPEGLPPERTRPHGPRRSPPEPGVLGVRSRPEPGASPRWGAPEPDPSSRRETPEAGASPRWGAPEPDPSPRRDTLEADASPRRDAPDADASPRRSTPDAEASSLRGTPGTDITSRRGTPAEDASPRQGVPESQVVDGGREAERNGPSPGPRHPVPPVPPAVEAAPWLPLRTLTHTTPAGPVAIPLDDLDPYRDLDDPVPPARLDADEAAEWQRIFDSAVALLAATGTAPGPGRLDPARIRAVVPYGRTALDPPAPPTVGVSASSGDSFGAMLISRPGSALALAETLVHEFQHSKLAALLHLFPLLDDDREERYYAPWRADPRHLTGLLHGAYAFTGVAGFWRDRLAQPEHAETAAYHFALRRLQSRLVVRTLLTSGRLTAPGQRLVSGLARTLDGWLREPVAPAALARARTAAALHRTQWRLRNVAAADGPDGALRFRPDRAFWPDTRTHAFATRPAAPLAPDEHLAAGDPAAALDGYTEALARDPADPHARSGWIVARAALDPGPATRRTLARPELLQPQPSR
ncbi:radical SAM protein [Streptomyces ambofaciens]|uniref:Radical SAM protein n=1 Tax=Streptomyces ambofaciens TaxID=1889 RepID=A0ABN4PFZ7_STRAM|nr:HEXXH motif-containing putative peptide modification protein [Streptomyces ambofaciens]ANB09134.1 radical SAM protein [Streptomyces ambofaciens]